MYLWPKGKEIYRGRDQNIVQKYAELGFIWKLTRQLKNGKAKLFPVGRAESSPTPAKDYSNKSQLLDAAYAFLNLAGLNQ